MGWGIRQTWSFRPHLILCGHLNFSPLCQLLKRLFDRPYFTIAHGIEAWNLSPLYQGALQNSKRIISVSRFTRDRILDQIHYNREKTALLPNTFDHHRFQPGQYPDELAQKWGIKEGDKVLLTIGRLSAKEGYKGYDKVIKCLPRLKERFPQIKYLLVGSGDDRPRIERLVEKRNLKETVILTGFVPEEELARYYRLCDVFVMPSKGEGFGIVFLEALGCGRPVIGGNKDGSRDALRDGELGELVNPDDLEEIEDAITRVLKREEKRDWARLVRDYFAFDSYREKVRKIIEEGPNSP